MLFLCDDRRLLRRQLWQTALPSPAQETECPWTTQCSRSSRQEADVRIGADPMHID